MWKPHFLRGRISVFKAISANCLLQLQIGQCGNHSFAIVEMLCRANMGRDYDSWFFRCRNLSFVYHGTTQHPDWVKGRGKGTLHWNSPIFPMYKPLHTPTSDNEDAWMRIPAIDTGGGEWNKNFPFCECRNLLLLLRVVSEVGGAQFFTV